MAEKINLAVFDIDVDSLVKSAQSVKQRIDEIKEEMKEMTKEGKTSSEAFINNAVSLRELNKEYSAQLRVLGEVASANNKIIPLEQQLDKIYARETKTINDLRKQNSDLLKTRNNLDLNNVEHAKLLAEINAKYDENTKLIKDNVSQREKEMMSVGGYTEAIKEAFNQTGLLGGALKDLADVKNSVAPVMKSLVSDWGLAAKALTSATTASGKLSAALKILRLALISTGIGAIVVALGSLVAYLKTTSEGVDKLNRVLIPLKTVLQTVVGLLQEAGKALVSAFKNPRDLLDSFLDALRPVGLVLEGIATFNWTKTKQGFQELGDQMKGAARATSAFFSEAWERGTEIAKLTEQINASELNMVKNQARLKRELNETREISKDTSRSILERNKASEESIRIAKELRDMELGHLDLLIARKKLEDESAGDTHAEALETAKLEAQRDEVQAEHAQLMIRLNNNLNVARKKGSEDASKAQDEAIQKQKELFDLYVAEQGFRANTLAQEIALETSLSEKRKAILDDELKFKKISQEKYNAELLILNNSIAKKQAELLAEDVYRQLQASEDKLEIEKNLNKHFSQERLSALETSENELRERRAAYEFLRYNEGLINETEYLNAIREINIEAENTLKAFRDERKAALQEERELDFETLLVGLQTQNEEVLALEGMMIEAQRERDKELAREKFTDEVMLAQAIANINAQADHAQAQLAITRDKVILQSKVDLLGAVAGLLGQETLMGKAAAIAQASINTYQGATMALASLPPPASFVAAAASIATGLASVAKITGINAKLSAKVPNAQAKSVPEILAPVIQAAPPFATGGVVRSGVPIRRSNGDNVLITAKRGEVVLNENQQRYIGEAAFRAAGVPGFATGGVVGSSATVQNTFLNSFDDKLVEALSEAVKTGAQKGTETGSQKGISDLSTERYIENLSSF